MPKLLLHHRHLKPLKLVEHNLLDYEGFYLKGNVLYSPLIQRFRLLIMHQI